MAAPPPPPKSSSASLLVRQIITSAFAFSVNPTQLQEPSTVTVTSTASESNGASTIVQTLVIVSGTTVVFEHGSTLTLPATTVTTTATTGIGTSSAVSSTTSNAAASTSVSSDGSSKSSSSNPLAIAFSAFVAIFIVCGVLIWFIWRKRRQRKQQKSILADQTNPSHDPNHLGATSYVYNGKPELSATSSVRRIFRWNRKRTLELEGDDPESFKRRFPLAELYGSQPEPQELEAKEAAAHTRVDDDL